MMLLAAGGAYCVLRCLQGGSLRWALAAGATLGFGIAIHELLLALYAAAWLAFLPLIWRRRQWRLLLGLTAGFLPPALLWAAANYWLYGTPLGLHLSASMGGNPTDHPYGIALIMNWSSLAERSLDQLVGTMIFGSRDDLYPYFLALACLLIGYAIMAWSGGWMRRVVPVLSIGAAGLAAYLVAQVSGGSGLFQATPLFIPALAVPWIASRSRARETAAERRTRRGKVKIRIRRDVPPNDLFWAWMSRASCLYILFALINPMLPGVDWGSRYLLPVLPFLVLLAAWALEGQYVEFGRIGRGVVVASVIALVAVSFYCQCEGLTMTARNMRYNRDVNDGARAVKSPVMVTDLIGLGPEMTAAFLPLAQFLVRTDDDRALFASVLRRMGATEFTYIDPDMDAQTFEGLTLSPNQYFVKVEAHPFIVKHADEDGQDLQFATFTLRTRQPASHP